MMTETHDTISPTLSCWSPLRARRFRQTAFSFRSDTASSDALGSKCDGGALCVPLFGSDPFGSISVHKGIGFNPNSFDFLGAFASRFYPSRRESYFEPFVFAPRPAHPWSIHLLLLNSLAFGGAIHFFLLRRRGVRGSCWD